jgi:hypothetical protein
MSPEAVGVVIALALVGWISFLVGRGTGWESGYEDGRVRTEESWELTCVNRGVAMYEQYLRRDGEHTRFVWIDEDEVSDE